MFSFSGNRWAVRLVSALALLLTAQMLWCMLSAAPAEQRPWPLSILDGGYAQYYAAHHPDSAASLPTAPGPQPPWYPPRAGLVNNLTAALQTPSGVYGFRFDGSHVPDADYGVYNWCNMPHVRRDIYVVPPPAFTLRYVELVHRHHKRTPYAANAFPAEPYRWDCDDARLHLYGRPAGRDDVDTDPHILPGDAHLRPDADADGNPFVAAAPGLHGSCRFPQLARGGLVDAWQHGVDLYRVYHDLLHFLPDLASDTNTTTTDTTTTDTQAAWAAQTAFRVTNNQITSETAAMVWGGMLAAATGEEKEEAHDRQPRHQAFASPGWTLPFSVEPLGLDGLEPQYACPAGADAFAAITSTDVDVDVDGSSPDPDRLYGASGVRRSREWDAHLAAAAAADVFRQLDAASGVDPADRAFHVSFDHYYDNLSARRCHHLPDVVGIPRHLADTVFRLGQWEYSRMYRDDVRSLGASAALWGVWVAQLAAHLRAAAAAQGAQGAAAAAAGPRYRHNVAHDGSLSRLLSILQADDMVWPGMGSEVVVELWEKKNDYDHEHDPSADVNADSSADTTTDTSAMTNNNYYVRVLFGGRVLRSSHPGLADLDMRPLDTLLAYLDDLVGLGASQVPAKCNGTLPLWPHTSTDGTFII